MNLKLGFSPCPNDTFIFDALIHHKINTGGIDFDMTITDVEHLNKMAFSGDLDITKVSYHVYSFISKEYKILTSGSALGKNNGPLLVSKNKIYPDEIPNLKIAVPGKYTTANLLLGIFFPTIKEKKEYLFSDIEDAVLHNEVDAGLIIHENRFTYAEKGLIKIIDLGEYWEEQTSIPLPLGGIIIKRSVQSKIQSELNRLLKESIQYAYKYPGSGIDFIRQYSGNKKDEIIQQHIDLYVNDYSIDLGETGKSSIRELFRLASDKKLIPEINKDIFVE